MADPQPTKAFHAISASAVGLEMGLAVLVCWFIGDWLDKEYGTEPYLTFIMLAVGLGAAMKAVFRVAKQTKRALSESNETQDHDH